MRVNSQRNGDLASDLRNGLGDFVGQGAAVGVAQDDPGRPGGGGRLDRPQRIIRVPLQSVEEMLGVVDDFGRLRGAKGDRVADHPQVLVERDTENIMHVQVPALAHDGDRGRARADQGLHPLIVLGGDVAAPGHAEGGDLGVLQIQVAHRAEIGSILGVGKRIAPLDIVKSRFVEPRRDEQLVLKREIDSLALAAVAQCGVVNEDSRHGFGTSVSATPANLFRSAR